MYRAAVPAFRSAARLASPALRLAAPSFVRPSVVAVPVAFARRAYAGHGPDMSLTVSNVEARILDIFRTFDKVNQDNLTLDAAFTKDLGLDSLDAVEVIMAIEEEFFVEIPDADADEIRTVRQAVDYIVNNPDAGLH